MTRKQLAEFLEKNRLEVQKAAEQFDESSKKLDQTLKKILSLY